MVLRVRIFKMLATSGFLAALECTKDVVGGRGTARGFYLEFSDRGCNGRQGGLGDRSPPAGSRGRAPVGSGGEAPRSCR